MTDNFPTKEEQRAAIMKNFGQHPTEVERIFGKPVVRIFAYARQFASAIVYVDGSVYDVDVYRDRDGVVKTGDTFNRAFDRG